MTLTPYIRKDDCAENRISNVYECLQGIKMPDASKTCDYCSYVVAVNSAARKIFVELITGEMSIVKPDPVTSLLFRMLSRFIRLFCILSTMPVWWNW